MKSIIDRSKGNFSKMNLIGYCRVSTEEQATIGVSLDVQEDRIRAYCKAKDWNLISIIRDEGISAKNLKRPGLQGIFDKAKKRDREFDGLIVYKLDRLTRSTMDLGILNDFFQKNKITFISIQEAVDTSTAAGELFHNIVVAISQWERKAISERTKSALQYKKLAGKRVGEIPYGYRLNRDRKSLDPIPEQQKILSEIKLLRQDGYSYKKIADVLNDENICTSKGGKWFPATIHSVLKHTA